MCSYTGDTKDPLRYNSKHLTDKSINDMTKTLLNETLESCSRVGLNPFYKLNPAPDVSPSGLYTLLHCSQNLEIPNLYYNLSQAGSAFWDKRYDEKATKKARAKTKAMKRNKNKSTTSDTFNMDEDEELEVDLDSLGSFFIHLIDTGCYQDDAETSQVRDDEVTIISSESEPLPSQKT